MLEANHKESACTPPPGIAPSDWFCALGRRYFSWGIIPLESGNFCLYSPDLNIHAIGDLATITLALASIPTELPKPKKPLPTPQIDISVDDILEGLDL